MRVSDAEGLAARLSLLGRQIRGQSNCWEGQMRTTQSRQPDLRYVPGQHPRLDSPNPLNWHRSGLGLVFCYLIANEPTSATLVAR